ncbi:DUF1569 domain-containing protein [Flavisericum labens]|uniref:DUF1569 domain-containing protein n=1 Tax=Flavisericum labens TaxID=3377112 RepID=UPI00387AAF7B
MGDIFSINQMNAVIDRINQLKPDAKPLWGKMSADQMLAHCNVTYEMVYEDKHPKPNAFTKFMLKVLVKNVVVGDNPYKRNSRTAPQFLITDTKNFVEEKTRLINFLIQTQKLGPDYFDGKESHSFGKLTKREWNNMFYKHLDHHLSQFGV